MFNFHEFYDSVFIFVTTSFFVVLMKPHNLDGLDACVFLSLFSMRRFYSINERRKKPFYSSIFGHFGRFTWNFVFVLLSLSSTLCDIQTKKKSYICFDANSTKWVETILIFFLVRLLVKVVDWSVDTFRSSSFLVILRVRFGNSSFLYYNYNLDFIRFLLSLLYWSFTF